MRFLVFYADISQVLIVQRVISLLRIAGCGVTDMTEGNACKEVAECSEIHDGLKSRARQCSLPPVLLSVLAQPHATVRKVALPPFVPL